MSDIKPIETRYKGYRFRSRLEARWAVFFDALGMKWEYENEGYELPDGTRYLPDFWLPDLSLFIEIKGVEPTQEEIAKAQAIGWGVAALAVFTGMPDYPLRKGTLFCNDTTDSSGGIGEWEVWWAHDAKGPYLSTNTQREDRVLVGPNWESIRAGSWEKAMEWAASGHQDWQKIALAAEAARSARFEYGESGAQ